VAITPSICHKCGATARVKDSRPRENYKYRRRHCECGEKWTTVELRIPDGIGTPVDNRAALVEWVLSTPDMKALVDFIYTWKLR